jgi:hypothetical protein
MLGVGDPEPDPRGQGGADVFGDSDRWVAGHADADMCLKELVTKGLISREHAREKARTPDNF